mgnify:CR=1 FL=1
MYQPANAVRLHVSLAEIDPPIWRRLVVPSDWTLDRLHLVLQAAFSWTDSHLHEFRIGGLRYGDPDQLEDGFGGPQIFDYTGVRLADFTGEELTFTYLYDFGDDWTHVIRIEEWLSLDPLPPTQNAPKGPVPGRPRTSAAPGPMPISSRPSAIRTTRTTAPTFAGPAGISIRTGSTST